MKRLHVHVGVTDIDRSVSFYSTLFGTEPSVVKDDYAKWKLDDPAVNFAISRRLAPGLDHLGIQVDEAGDLAALAERLSTAGAAIAPQEAAECCYARSNKAWTVDPSGIAWETFHTLAEIPVYGEDHAPEPPAQEACCAAQTDA